MRNDTLLLCLWAARLYAGRTALWFVPLSALAAAGLARVLLAAFGSAAPFSDLLVAGSVAQAAFAAVAFFVRRYPERYLGRR